MHKGGLCDLCHAREGIKREWGIFCDGCWDSEIIRDAVKEANLVHPILSDWVRDLRIKMSKPIGVQRKRIKGWRKPDNTINVTRPGKWGNPIKKGDWVVLSSGVTAYVNYNKEAVRLFKKLVKNSNDHPIKKLTLGIAGETTTMITYPTDFKELKGKNLMCWCPLGSPCHRDILLEVANG